MTQAAVLLAAGAGTRFAGPEHKLRSLIGDKSVLGWSLDAALSADCNEVVVVVGADDFADLLQGTGVTVVTNMRWQEGQAHSMQTAVSHAASMGHEAFVVGVADQPFVGASAWQAVAAEVSAPIAIAEFAGDRRPPVRLAAEVWSLLPSDGDEGARNLLRTRPDLVVSVPSSGDPSDVDTIDALQAARSKYDDHVAVTALLGRTPQGRFEVVVRDDAGAPVVLRNHPVLDDGRPMPTLYWLCGERERVLVGRLESGGGVRRAEEEVGLDAIADAHAKYRAERDALLGTGTPPLHTPSGGVGGTRTGVKCLHAHYAWWLAGGADPVGRWVADHLAEVDT